MVLLLLLLELHVSVSHVMMMHGFLRCETRNAPAIWQTAVSAALLVGPCRGTQLVTPQHMLLHVRRVFVELQDAHTNALKASTASA
jgi:hypothetical protein